MACEKCDKLFFVNSDGKIQQVDIDMQRLAKKE